MWLKNIIKKLCGMITTLLLSNFKLEELFPEVSDEERIKEVKTRLKVEKDLEEEHRVRMQKLSDTLMESNI